MKFIVPQKYFLLTQQVSFASCLTNESMFSEIMLEICIFYFIQFNQCHIDFTQFRWGENFNDYLATLKSLSYRDIHSGTLGYTRLRFYDINLVSFKIAYHLHIMDWMKRYALDLSCPKRQRLEVSENVKYIAVTSRTSKLQVSKVG